MKHIRPIEYRTKREAPTELGWFYGRFCGAREIMPVLFDIGHTSDMRAAWLPGIEMKFNLDDFDWYGPVAECREG